jgi:hypothetical protein
MAGRRIHSSKGLFLFYKFKVSNFVLKIKFNFFRPTLPNRGNLVGNTYGSTYIIQI